MTKLIVVEGIGETYAGKLKAAGIGSVEALRQKGGTPAGRKAIEEQAGISHALLLDWVNRCDLFRIKGVGKEYSDLLERAGVDTVVELAQRKPENLYTKMVEVNKSAQLVRRLPTQAQVADWVTQAKALPRIVEY
jgi:predicted flap endonuclease-1-like 5' DNA nuclease